MTRTYFPQEVIRRKRDGLELESAEIDFLVRCLSTGQLANEQVGAFAMATCLRGMTKAETIALTTAMRDSGHVMDWSDLEGVVVDKHSTGGIGDKLSLLIAPIIAACGGFVPMISGRGLGHTGGTLDKLESIPGYNTRPSRDRFQSIVRDVGCAIVGQTEDLAPADRRLYAIRDVTATVESLPLITSSILSKKLAAGLDVLVMDVKYGSGAFMVELEDARELAQTIVDVASGAGVRCCALITNMDRCLGRTAGNALEVLEAVEILKGEKYDEDVVEITLAICGEALARSGIATDRKHGLRLARAALESGAGSERFGRMVEALGGPADFMTKPERYLPEATVRLEVGAHSAGYVAAIDARALGLAIIGLGGGRTSSEQSVDQSVGLSDVQKPGEYLRSNEPLAVLHAATHDAARDAAERVRAAFVLAENPPMASPNVAQIIEA